VVRVLIVVRHAVAVDREDWTGPDLGRPLTPAGERQAAGLVVRLDPYPVQRILSSPALRCLDTVAPLARRRLVPVEPFAPLGVDAPTTDLLDVLWDEHELHDAVLCTHGEVVGEVLSALAADGRFDGGPPRWPKGSTWLLQRRPGGRVTGRYLPPLAYDPDLWPAGDLGLGVPAGTTAGSSSAVRSGEDPR